MFKVIIRGRNCRKYLSKCVESLARQTVTDWSAVLILDAPTDGTEKVAPIILEEYGVSEKIEVIVRQERLGLCANMWDGLCECDDLEPDDIVCVLDADDYLSRKALRVVQRAYEKNPSALLTYGSYKKMSKNGKTRTSRPYKKGCDVRSAKWHGSHFKTFKWKLAKQLSNDCFLHNGKYMDAASDVALMLPLMEMAGLDRCVHIKRMIYVWRDSTPHKTDREAQMRCEKTIRAKRKMRRFGL